MPKPKRIVCYCHDVTEEDIASAIRDGHDDIESLKRFTACTMGPCQGRLCLHHLARILGKATRSGVPTVGLPTARPPSRPVPLGILAAEEGREGH